MNFSIHEIVVLALVMITLLVMIGVAIISFDESGSVIGDGSDSVEEKGDCIFRNKETADDDCLETSSSRFEEVNLVET